MAISENHSDVSDWWRTSIIDMAPGQIRLRGIPIEKLIGEVSFCEIVWLMLRGALPAAGDARLLQAAMVAAVDHGPQAPSIAAARMSVSCGLGLNGALADAVNMLDDVHGGAGEQAIELYQIAAGKLDRTGCVKDAARASVDHWQETRGKFLPGFGHRFHKPDDPRAPRLLALVREAAEAGIVGGEYADIAEAIGDALAERIGRRLALNIDGSSAVIYAELGFDPPLARGLFCLSRGVGALAHGWEQMQRGERNKGPTPPRYRWKYDGFNPIEPEA